MVDRVGMQNSKALSMWAVRFHLLKPCSRSFDYLGALRTHQCLRRVLDFAVREVPYLETLVAYFLLDTLTRQMVRYGHEFGGSGSKWLFLSWSCHQASSSIFTGTSV
jgi:hypothetical protein